ncbi:testis-expressed protein 15 isoform X2 [Tachyglossus aculeatus]|uniref:testis-expressed protein 15 isoform X2 n=1 Tax=Tachyglossus aculeatus TaxID=9261 RepID=UPI0018F4A8F1|nr:testis-expressed protein 15 isoform X2 [Tachyglossus aculeatus]
MSPICNSSSKIHWSENGCPLYNIYEVFVYRISQVDCNNVESSTVITSKLIKDPRLMRREGNNEIQNPKTDVQEIPPSENDPECCSSDMSLSSPPPDTVFLPESIMGSCSYPNNSEVCQYAKDPVQDTQWTTIEDQRKDQNSVDSKALPLMSDDKIISKEENQKDDGQKAKQSRQMSNFLGPIKWQNKVQIPSPKNHSPDPVTSVQANSQKLNSKKSQSSNLETVPHTSQKYSSEKPLHGGEKRTQHLQSTEKLMCLKSRMEGKSICRKMQDPQKENGNHCTTGKKNNSTIFSIPHNEKDILISSHQEHKYGTEVLNSFGKNDQVSTLGHRKLHPSTFTKEKLKKDDMDLLACELLSNGQRTEDRLQKQHEDFFPCEKMDVDQSLATSQSIIDLDMENSNSKCIKIKSNASQKVEDTPAVNETLNGLMNTSSAIYTPENNEIMGKNVFYLYPLGKNERALEINNKYKDNLKTFLDGDVFKDQDPPVFCNPDIGDAIRFPSPYTDFKQVCQLEKKYNIKERDSQQDRGSCASEGGKRVGNTSTEKGEHSTTIEDLTNIFDSLKEIKKYDSLGTTGSERFSSGVELTCEERCAVSETASIKVEIIATAMKEKGINEHGDVNLQQLPATAVFSHSADPSVSYTYESSNTSNIPLPILNLKPSDSQRNQIGEMCVSESVSEKNGFCDWECSLEKDNFQELSQWHILEEKFKDLIIQGPDFESEIEVALVQCEDSLKSNHGDAPNNFEEFNSVYYFLKSRIDWRSLFESGSWRSAKISKGELIENRNQCTFQGNNFHSCIQQNAKPLNTAVLPDLKIRITNVLETEFDSYDPYALDEDLWECVFESLDPEIDIEWPRGVEIKEYSQPAYENPGQPFEDELGSCLNQETELLNEWEVSLYRDSDCVPEKQSCAFLTEPAIFSESMNSASDSSLENLKNNCDEAQGKIDRGSNLNKRKRFPTSQTNEVIPHKNLQSQEDCRKRLKVVSHQPFEKFSSLSEGRIKTFSRSEKHIRSVLNTLNSEVSLCKSRRLSKKLDRAVSHLKKAQRGVHRSLQLVAKVGEKRREGPLPKSYEVTCNNFWESCDLEGFRFVTERKYHSTRHSSEKRKYAIKEEKKTVASETGNTQTRKLKHKCKRKGVRTRKSVSTEDATSKFSRGQMGAHKKKYRSQENVFELDLAKPSSLQSTRPSSACKSGILKNQQRPSYLQAVSEKVTSLDSTRPRDRKLPNEVDQADFETVPKMHHKDTQREFCFVSDKYLSEHHSRFCISPEENIMLNSDQLICKDNSVMNPGVLISVLKSNGEHFNVDTYKSDVPVSSVHHESEEVTLHMEKFPVLAEDGNQNIGTAVFPLGSDKSTPIADQNFETQISPCPQILSIRSDSWKSILENIAEKALGVHVVEMSISLNELQENNETEISGEELYSSNACSQRVIKEMYVAESASLELLPVSSAIGIGNCENKAEMCSLNDSPGFFGDNSLIRSHTFVSQEDNQNSGLETGKINLLKDQTDPPNEDMDLSEDISESPSAQLESVEHRCWSLEAGCMDLTEDRQLKNDPPVSTLETTNNSSASYGTISWKETTPSLDKRKENWKVKNSSDSQLNSKSHSEILYNPKQGNRRVTPIQAFGNISHQEQGTIPEGELKEKHCFDKHAGLIDELSEILRRADEASSWEAVQVQLEFCESILPVFIDAFERKQNCSFKHILVSHKLLVEDNLWNNCKTTLRPQAIDSFVELQMVMETIQFVENKKSLLRREPTFRSLLWYDDSLYHELFEGQCGYQQQSSFCCSFQQRLKYDTWSELKSHHLQLSELFKEIKRENISYYSLLKCQREIDECEAVLQHSSDVFRFTLSLPFICGANFGESLDELETLKKCTLELLRNYWPFPKVNLLSGKQDHLWMIIEVISSKINFIKSCESRNVQISLFGMEHIFFDAAKSLVWKNQSESLSKMTLPVVKKAVLFKLNQDALSGLQEIHKNLAEDLRFEKASNLGSVETDKSAPRKSSGWGDKAKLSMENRRFNHVNRDLLLRPDIGCVGQIIEQVELADLDKLGELRLRCTDHLETLKRHFQMLQEEDVNHVLISEDNVLDIVGNHNISAVILRPETVEIYVEIVMLSETVHFLKNVEAKKLGKEKFRGMLWFDSSLLPELIHSQKTLTSFSFLQDVSTDGPGDTIESAILKIKAELDMICTYSEAINYSYAFQLLSRELTELSEIRKLIEKPMPSVSTYVHFEPYTVSVNYGNTVTALEYNFKQFSVLLENLMSAPREDLGKIAHIMKIMKTIDQMMLACAQNEKPPISLLLCQMLRNRRKAHQLKKNKDLKIPMNRPGKTVRKASICFSESPIPGYLIKNDSSSRQTKSFTFAKCEDTQKPFKSLTLPSRRGPKVATSRKEVPKMRNENEASSCPRYGIAYAART